MLARWSGWGAVPQVFDDTDDRYTTERDELRRLLGSDQAWAAARRTTLNAHYTGAEVVQAIWRTAQALGFTAGRVLEPGAGSGNFIGFAPDGAQLVGVELDPTTAAIADHLYGARARIHAGGFEDFVEPDGAFDLVVGNVPFGKISPYDPRHNRGGATLHNYFIIKSLALTRPGGLVLALTSRYTLDSRNPAPRREMTRLADLVGAVRLPERAFAAAGTDVVADLLILRRRQPGTPPLDTAWVGTEPLDPPPGLSPETLEALAAEPLAINQYLARRPDQILGHLAVDRGMYRQHELTVKPDGALGPRLTETLDRLVYNAVAQGATFSPAPARSRTTAAGAVTGDFDLRHAQEGSLVAARGGVVGRYVGGQVVAYRPRNSKDLWELRRLIGLRDAAREVLAVQLRGGTSDELTAAQHQLTDRYQDYKRLYGPLNRFRMVRTGRSDPDTGAAATRRDLPRMGGFRALDPDWALVAALEVFDDDTQTATRAPIFTQQVVAPPVRRSTVDSPADAVAVCLDESGTVTTERVAELLQTPEDQARGQLDGLVFADPATGDLVPSARYLSGNIRHKLAAARTAAERDSRWAANVAALEEVLPAQLEPGEITARLGAPWIPAHDIEAFCLEVLDAEVDIEYLADLGRWDLGLRMGSRRSVAMSSQWGTQRASAIDLLDASLNQRLYTVYDPGEDSNRRVRNDAETLAARDKQEVLGDRFGAWVWEDPTRASRLAGVYNELFRSVVLPRHDGSHLSLPGLAATFTPHPHQRDAVARILTDGRALLAHAVGAGKTATMVMAAMELRRLGAAAEPALIVPNLLLGSNADGPVHRGLAVCPMFVTG